MEENHKNFFGRITSSDTILVALVTLIGYLAVLSYEIGYFEYFNIPIQLIRFDISILSLLVKKAFPILVFFSLIILFILALPYSMFQELKNIRWKVIILILAPSVGILIFGIAIGRNIQEILLYIGASLLWLITYVAIVFISIKLQKIIKVKPFLRRIFFHINKTGIATPNSAKYQQMEEEMEGINRRGLLVVVAVAGFYFVALCYAFGNFTAKENIEFMVIKSNPDCAILYYTTQESAICSPFNKTTKELEKTFKFINLYESGNPSINVESIGPLHFKPTPTKTPLPKPTTIPSITPTP